MSKRSKRSVTVRLDAASVERLLNAAWWRRKTLTDLIADQLPAILRAAEAPNNGKPYPPREEQ